MRRRVPGGYRRVETATFLISGMLLDTTGCTNQSGTNIETGVKNDERGVEKERDKVFVTGGMRRNLNGP